LGLMQMGAEGADVHRRSLATLQAYQTPLGNIPHNVGFTGIPDPALVAHGGALRVSDDDQGKVVTDTVHAGCIDNALWYIIGQHYTAAVDGDLVRLRASWSSIERAHLWLRYQDSNECGLLEVHEAMDWADLFANRYNSLWPNVLWFAANRAMARMARLLNLGSADGFEAAAEDIRFKVNTLLWVGPEHKRDLGWVERNRKEWLYPIRATDTLYQERPYYLPYMAFRGWCDRFDAFGNLAAVLFGLASEAQADRIFDYIQAAGVAEPWPIKAVTPPVMPGEADWREYYRLRNLNLPNQYHNGGAWPFLGGFYVAALERAGRHQKAAETLERLAEMNRQARFGGEWEFNEWFHGVSGRPMGFARQSWSAAMFVFAHESVKRGSVPVFGEEGLW
ncbi:MAG TPA: glycoside hydrolase 100 family protein, partial [Deinococcales bacterium]|nr:glycoside hydrolase 100 family protein [Deinococcales bacterium]